MLPWLALILLAPPAQARKNQADPPPPPTVSTPSDPGATQGPYADAMPLPPISGRGTELKLESLSRVQRSFTISVDMSPVNVPGAAVPSIQRHVAADARWRLVERDGALVAHRRDSRGREHHIDMTGYHHRPREVYATAIRFGEWSEDGRWATSPHVSRSPAASSSLSVDTFFLEPEAFYGWETTAISIEGDGMFVDIYEASKKGGRDRTAEALGDVLGYLGGLAADPHRIETDGYHKWYMARREPSRDGPEVDLSTQGRGTLVVQARVNPGRAGWTWLRILDDQLSPWEEEAVGAGTRERIGYSNKEAEVFFMGSTMPVSSGDKFSGTAELWFLADGAEEPERLLALPVVVPKR